MAKNIKKSIKKHKLLKSAKKNIKSKKTMTIIALIAVLVVLAVVFNLNRFLLSKPEIVATVNGKDITSAQLEEQYNLFFFLAGYPESYKQFITKESFVENLINEELLLQEASKKRISVLDKEVDNALEELMSRSGISKGEFEISLNNAGFRMKDLYDYYKKQMVISRLLNETFSTIEITINVTK